MDRWLTRIENAIIVATMLIGFVLATAQVILRYVFNFGFVWIEPTVVSLAILGAFIGGAQAVGRGMHVRVGILVDWLPEGLRRAVATLAMLISLAYCAFLLYVSTLYARFLEMNGITNVDTGLPQWLFGAIAPVAMAMFCIRYIMRIPHVLAGGADGGHPGSQD